MQNVKYCMLLNNKQFSQDKKNHTKKEPQRCLIRKKNEKKGYPILSGAVSQQKPGTHQGTKSWN